MQRILITGCSGLIGGALRMAMAKHHEVVGLDLRGEGREQGDVRDLAAVRAAVAGCDGIVHLAAVSRVIWGERDPAACRATNIGGVENVLEAAAAQARPPWLLFASSREVYGEPRDSDLPVNEDAPLRPVNVYGRTKVEGEQLVVAARERGVRSAVVRLSNVYGGVHDHADRVVPAFVGAAVMGAPLRVEGGEHTFDFTHLGDVTRGLIALVDVLRLDTVSAPPPIHLLTGRATTLAELARLAVAAARREPPSAIVQAPARNFDVARFVGDPGRAAAMLDWRATVSVGEGVRAYSDAMCRALTGGPS